MKIGLDLDGTLLDTSFISKHVHKKHNKIYFPAVTYDMFNWPRVCKQEFLKMFEEDNILIYQTPVHSGTLEKIIEWQKEHDIYVITARKYFDKTKQFVKTLLGIDNCYVVSNQNKVDYMKRLGIDLWIDDFNGNVVESLNAGIRTIMISNEDTVYNHYLRGSVEWYKNISEINL